MTTTTTDARLEPVTPDDTAFDDAFIGDAPTDEELEEMFCEWEAEDDDTTDWRDEISRDYERIEGRAIQRSLERYR